MRSCRLSSIRPASTTDRVWKVPLTNRRSLRRRTPDGKHIAMFPVPAQAAQGPPRATFILNFFDYLRRTVPQGKWSVRDTICRSCQSRAGGQTLVQRDERVGQRIRFFGSLLSNRAQRRDLSGELFNQNVTGMSQYRNLCGGARSGHVPKPSNNYDHLHNEYK